MKWWQKLKDWNKRKPVPPAVPHERRARTGASYSTDQPVRAAADDRFGRKLFAHRIADTIATRPDEASLVMGLYGPWGDGKTSVLFMIEEQLMAYDDIVVVRFNPWHFTSEEQLIRGFFDTLSTAAGASLTTRAEEFGEVMRDYGALSSALAGDAVAELGRALSTTSLEELKVRVEGFLEEAGSHVVVLIDDIDRLDRRETHLIFKLVKLSAGFKHTTYLLAFDDSVVAAALGERYGAGGEAAGRGFLEKIVQVPLHLPPADAIALRKLAFEGVNAALEHAVIELSQPQVDAFVLNFTSGLDESLRTPRQARVYANALLFALPLVKGEVNIADFMLLEALRVFHPKLHQMLRDNAGVVLMRVERDREAHRQRFAQLVEHATPGMVPELRERLKDGLLLHLFPRTGSVGYETEWETEWAREKRVCAQSYFSKFFSYGSSMTEVSDRVVDEFIQTLPTQAPDDQDVALRLLASPEAVASFARRLRQREDSVPGDVVPVLAHAIARNGALFPLERGPFVAGGTRAQAAILITNLLKSVPDPQTRFDLAASLLRHAEPLPFASELLRWFSPRRSAEESTWVFDQDRFTRLRQLLVAERLQTADATTPLYRQFGGDAGQMYWWWHEVDAAGLSARLLQQFDQGPEEIDAFLDMHVGEAWEMGTGMPHRSDLEGHGYKEIARLVDPNEVARRLRARYGSELDDPQEHHGNEVPLPRRFAHQFMVAHREVQEREASELGSSTRSRPSIEDQPDDENSGG
jgi:predicted KAP-like P-loop ATPase